jgi:beta-N-acetylhexosaminidase
LIRCLEVAAAAGLFLYALEHRVPTIHRLRSGFPLAMLAAATLAAVALRSRIRIVAALSLAAVFSGLAVEARFVATRAQVLKADAAALERVGRHLAIGFDDFDEVRALVERGALAGIFLAPRNVHGRSVAAIHDQIGWLRSVQAGAGRPELLVLAEQEGGKVSRLSPPRLPAMAEVLATTDDPLGREMAASAFGSYQGEGLAAMGST